MANVFVPEMKLTECRVHADTDLELNLTCGLKIHVVSILSCHVS